MPEKGQGLSLRRESQIIPENSPLLFYDAERPHQALGYRIPAEVFNVNPVKTTIAGVVESLTPDPLRIVDPNINITPILS